MKKQLSIVALGLSTALATAFAVTQTQSTGSEQHGSHAAATNSSLATPVASTTHDCHFDSATISNAHQVNQVTVPATDGGLLSFDQHEVTNLQFRQFVDATGYITLAERGVAIDSNSDFNGLQLQPGSAVFMQPDSVRAAALGEWWAFVPGANWQQPTGPDSHIDGKDHYPVVQLSYEDVEAYAQWAGRRLPTASEWEQAARYNENVRRKSWHKRATPGYMQTGLSSESKGSSQADYLANTWQGIFPLKNKASDGHADLAPVGCYRPLASQLYDMVGNVWEWVDTDLTVKTPEPNQPTATFKGQTVAMTHENATTQKIMGGSFLCSPNFCMNYHPSAYLDQDVSLGTNHIGFRTVVSVEKVAN